jgi:hypothetical protein
VPDEYKDEGKGGPGLTGQPFSVRSSTSADCATFNFNDPFPIKIVIFAALEF